MAHGMVLNLKFGWYCVFFGKDDWRKIICLAHREMQVFGTVCPIPERARYESIAACLYFAAREVQDIVAIGDEISPLQQ
jgi:hypothetical protein